MKGSIVTVDVSKGSCHYQPFFEKGKPFRKPKVLHDTIEGFAELSSCVQKYREDHEMPYYIISPLLSAKYRQTNLHTIKLTIWTTHISQIFLCR